MIPTVALVAVLPLSACESSIPTTEERLDYLRQIAQQGAETGVLLRDQEAPDINKDRCGRAFEGLTRPEDYPSDLPNGEVSKNWSAQIREVFVDSCVSGKAKAKPGETTTTTITEPTTTTTTAPPETTTTAAAQPPSGGAEPTTTTTAP